MRFTMLFSFLAFAVACHRSAVPRMQSTQDDTGTPSAGTTATRSTFSGTVVDASTSAPIDGAIVSLMPDSAYDAGAEATSGQTGSGGDFTVANIHAGRYFVDVVRKGYKSTTSKVSFFPGQSRGGYRFKLSPTSPVGTCPRILAGKPNPLCP